jgi:MFS family permease
MGGWLSTHWCWRWIFLLNVPLGVLALTAALILVRDRASERRAFDIAGFLTSAFGFGLFMSGIEAASRADIRLSLSLGMLLAGVVLMLLTARHLRRVEHPLFDLGPLRIDTFRVTAVGGSIFRIAIGTAPFLLPLMFQLGFGYSAVDAGVLLLWLFAGNLCMKPGTGWIMNRFGFRRVLIVNGMLVAAVGALALSMAALVRGGAGSLSAADFGLAFWLIAALAALAIIDSLFLPVRAGERVLRKSER